MELSQVVEFIKQNLLWLIIAYPFACIVGYYLYYRLIGRRLYKCEDGKLYVKEGIGEWQEIMEHFKYKHHYNQAEINELMLKARRMLRENDEKEKPAS